MTTASKVALDTLRQVARGHASAFSGEIAAWEILGNLRKGTPLDFAGDFVRLDGTGKRAVVQLLVDLAGGKTGLSELR